MNMIIFSVLLFGGIVVSFVVSLICDINNWIEDPATFWVIGVYTLLPTLLYTLKHAI